jgi:hypothetical protein
VTLLDLAKEKFAREFSTAEVELFTKVEIGQPALALAADDKDNDPANVSNWPNLASRTVHAECLTWLCTDKTASSRVTYRGIDIQGMRLEGSVRLDFSKIEFPLNVWKCSFTEAIDLRFAEVPAIYFRFAHIKGLLGDGLKVSDWLLFQNSRSDGEVKLLGCTLGGGLGCDETEFINVGSAALILDTAKISGPVYMRTSKVRGEVRFVGAQIEGDLDCGGADFQNPEEEKEAKGKKAKIGGTALNAGGAKVRGYIFLRNGFRSKGSINLQGATIGRALECDRSELTNVDGVALFADGSKIDGYVLLRSCTVKGQVNFLGATVGRNLECDGSRFENPERQEAGANGMLVKKGGIALLANAAKIEGSVFVRKNFKAIGEVNFLRAAIAGHVDCEAAEFNHKEGKALNLDSSSVGGSVYLRSGAKTHGETNFNLATIRGGLDCSGATLTSPEQEVKRHNGTIERVPGIALMASAVTIDGSVFLRNEFTCEGTINFSGARIGGSLECLRTQITSLNCERALVAGSMLIQGQVREVVNLFGSTIGSLLVWSDVKLGENTILDLRLSKVGTLRDDRNWPAKDKLFLDGFVYGRIDHTSATDAESRISWLERQPSAQFLPQPYEQLALVLDNMGHEGQAREVRVEKNRAYARAIAREIADNAKEKKSWRKTWTRIWARLSKQEWWWHNIFGRLNGYGYKPWRAFFLSLAVIFLGWGLFHFGYTRNLISPERDNAFRKNVFGHVVTAKNIPQKHRLSKSYPKFNALAYSLESFVPLLKLDQSANWTPNAHNGRVFFLWRVHLTTGTLLRAYLWFHIIIGWILTSLWIGGLTGLVKT